MLGIVGILMVLSGPSVRQWKAGIDLRGTAAKVSELMLESRTKAIVERTTRTVSVDYATDTCAVAPGGASVHDEGVDLYADTADPDCPPLSDRTLQFRPNGTADAAGYEAVYLRSRNAAVTVRYRVKVLGATGKVGVDKWRGGEWVSAR